MKRKTLHAPFGPFTKNYYKVLHVKKVSQTSKSSLQSMKKIAKTCIAIIIKGDVATFTQTIWDSYKKNGLIFVFNEIYVTVTEFEATTSSFVNNTSLKLASLPNDLANCVSPWG